MVNVNSCGVNGMPTSATNRACDQICLLHEDSVASGKNWKANGERVW